MQACSPVIIFSCLFGASCGEYRTIGRIKHLTFSPDKEHSPLIAVGPLHLAGQTSVDFPFGFLLFLFKGSRRRQNTGRSRGFPKGHHLYARISSFFCLCMQRPRLCSLPLQLFAMGFEVPERCRINRLRSLAQHQKLGRHFPLITLAWI